MGGGGGGGGGGGLLGERGVEPTAFPIYFVFYFCILIAFILLVYFYSYS